MFLSCPSSCSLSNKICLCYFFVSSLLWKSTRFFFFFSWFYLFNIVLYLKLSFIWVCLVKLLYWRLDILSCNFKLRKQRLNVVLSGFTNFLRLLKLSNILTWLYFKILKTFQCHFLWDGRRLVFERVCG
jgi:hypothetical protein